MEAPIVRNWRNSSGYTKGTYYACIFNMFLIFFGYRLLRNASASIWLTCDAETCAIQITPPGNVGTTKLEFSRNQIVKANAVKVDKDHVFQRLDSGTKPRQNTKYKKYKIHSVGPDKDGFYDSYDVALRPPGQDQDPNEKDLTPLEPFIYRSDESGIIFIPMRKYNLGRTKRRTKTMIMKVQSYTSQRRNQLTMKENAPLSWQGTVSIIFGMFLLLLTILIGQFVDETKTVGPGVRRSSRKVPANSRRKISNGKMH
eukprot:CAMPEP_0178939004 /NCGR_PEP_ID=MMETSP0786-20121207/26644_1 /TAXON_ID=186022 /ORGANISM="Thalassionema frauenfeldii, Strain CCMP 1798" /LENGTH=255 /DNA_ID=CAMNT_0020617783 /DNA_START=177 /DNA_END=944 /DNA_ORIENTATION=+